MPRSSCPYCQKGIWASDTDKLYKAEERHLQERHPEVLEQREAAKIAALGKPFTDEDVDHLLAEERD